MKHLKALSRQALASALLLLLTLSLVVSPARAGDRLLASSGVSQVEGAAGGGLSPWALIAGGGSRDQIGASVFGTHIRTRGGYVLESFGAAVGFYDTVELSVARQRFGLADTVPGENLGLDVFGAKWRVFGDAVFEADPWLPQVSLGLQYKHNRDMAVPSLLGARKRSDTEPYIAATKLWLGAAGGANLLTNVTLRGTRANQFGLLGFGGPKGDRMKIRPEVSIAILPRDNLAFGAEWRAKSTQLAAVTENRALDLFVAWWPTRNISLTLAYLDLGQVAVKSSQRSSYLSLQAQY